MTTNLAIAVGIGVVIVALLAILAGFYIALSGPVNEEQDPSQPKYQFFSERARGHGRWKSKDHRSEPEEPED
jgi:hypothetical protein